MPLNGSAKCDASWAPITRLAHWAEPARTSRSPPFRWVGYEGDAGHGCGNHLHLSWEHAPAPLFQLAEWVEVFPVGAGHARTARSRRSASGARAQPKPPAGGADRRHLATASDRRRLRARRLSTPAPAGIDASIGCGRPMRRRCADRSIAALAVALPRGAGCGGAERHDAGRLPRRAERLPRRPRRRAGEVRLGGETPISDCLAENQKAGDLATVGTAMVDRGDQAQRRSAGRAGRRRQPPARLPARRAQRGADGTEGIHAELIRRLAAAARYSPDNRPLPPAFLRTYRRATTPATTHG